MNHCVGSAPLEQRIHHALSQLVGRILPVNPYEDDDAAEDRFEKAFAFSMNQIKRETDVENASDVNHAADLIKKKLIRENSTPEKALRFSNLYSRLLTQRVLNQKWSMLFFLYRLSQRNQKSSSFIRAYPPGETLDSSLRRSLCPLPDPGGLSGDARGSEFRHTRFESDNGPSMLAELLPDRDKWMKRNTISNNGSIEATPHKFVEQSRERLVDRHKHGVSLEPSEAQLLRDLPFALQGVGATHFEFMPGNTIKLPKTLPIPVLSLLHVLAEPALLYRNLAEFVEASDGGLVVQSFRSALRHELRFYLSMVASLEGHVRRALASLDDTHSRAGLGQAGVTLRRCVLWVKDATMGLRLLSVMLERSVGKKGGELISLIHSFSLTHGDPFVSSFAERMLLQVTKPFYTMLQRWIYDGELSDPYHEFFVSDQNSLHMTSDAIDRRKSSGATSVWEEKYQINSKMIPSIMTPSFANKVFLIGKSLNFIRYGCNDSQWVDVYSKSASRELRYGDTAELETSIDQAYKTTMARLMHLMMHKFNLMTHLQALKKYILLGAGDFIALLMESLAPYLDRPANSQYRHTLTAQLEHAVRSSNAQYEPSDVLRRLDSRMLELSSGEIGWDVFTLEYKIDAPVDVIVTAFGAKQYLKVFNLLWRIKRVEFSLNTLWRRCMTGSWGILRMVSDSLGDDWKRARCAVGEMIHFVNQLQYYILFEVIESSWSELQTAVTKPECTLDDLIQAHAKYLTSITRKGLLGNSNADFASQLHELLKSMLLYRDAVDSLYSFSVAEFSRLQKRQVDLKIQRSGPAVTNSLAHENGKSSVFEGGNDATHLESVEGGLGTANIAGGPAVTGPGEDDLLVALRGRLANLSTDFRMRITNLLSDLLHQTDADLRWLAMVMNYNDFYQPTRGKRKATVRHHTHLHGHGHSTHSSQTIGSPAQSIAAGGAITTNAMTGTASTSKSRTNRLMSKSGSKREGSRGIK